MLICQVFSETHVFLFHAKKSSENFSELLTGDSRIWTGGKGVADPRLTTWLYRRDFYSIEYFCDLVKCFFSKISFFYFYSSQSQVTKTLNCNFKVHGGSFTKAVRRLFCRPLFSAGTCYTIYYHALFWKSRYNVLSRKSNSSHRLSMLRPVNKTIARLLHLHECKFHTLACTQKLRKCYTCMIPGLSAALYSI